jgi:hypothetical protein
MWIITAWQHISPEVTVKGVMNCCISSAMDGTNDCGCGMAVRKMGMLGVSSLKMKALTLRMQKVTLIGKGR